LATPDWFGGNINLLFGVDGNLVCYFDDEPGTGGAGAGSSQAVWPAGTWIHATCVYEANADTLTLYVNGTQVAQDTDTDDPADPTDQPFMIGAGDFGDGEYIDATIDEVRVYNRALGATEVAELYRAGASLQKPPNNLGLVGYWSFNEGTGTKATDFSGNSNTWTLTAGPMWTNGKRGKALSFDGSDASLRQM
jgi:hypothetical protein